MNESELELQRAFGRLEEKVDSLLHEVRTANSNHSKELTMLEFRIDALETWRTRLVAYSAGVTATIVLLLGLSWKILTLLQK